MQATIESNTQYYGDKIKKPTKYLTAMIISMVYQINISKSSPDNKDSPKAQDNTTFLPDNKRVLTLEDGNYTEKGGMWTLKHEIRSPNSMNSSSIQNLKATLLWTSITSTTTSRCVSM